MSSDDSLSEMSTPHRLMPKSQSLAEHHRVLAANALHHGNTLATIKAHKVRMDTLEERLETVEDLRDVINELKEDLVSDRSRANERDNQIEKMVASHASIIARIDDKLTEQKSGIDLKKAVVTGIVSIVLAIVTAFGGYVMGHPSASVEVYKAPTHEQAVEIDRKYKEMYPDNQPQFNK